MACPDCHDTQEELVVAEASKEGYMKQALSQADTLDLVTFKLAEIVSESDKQPFRMTEKIRRLAKEALEEITKEKTGEKKRER